jgi:putative aldouronate transport system permease protein
VKNKKMVGVFNKTLLYTILSIITILVIIPILLVISGSITDELQLSTKGCTIIPSKFSFYAYKTLFVNSRQILTSYKISVFVTVVGTVLSLAITTMMAYSLSRKDLKYGKIILFYSMFTLLFNGGMVSWYIIVAGMIHLKNSVWALILPYTVYAWNVFLMKNFMSTISPEMYESAFLDGAGEWRTFTSIILPLSKSALATVGLFICIAYWNDWWLAIMLIGNYKQFPLQLLLRTIMSSIQFMSSGKATVVSGEIARALPRDGIKFATAIITIGPLIFVYPFVQRYFIKGITIGAVKG